jgi:hypothetical protein
MNEELGSELDVEEIEEEIEEEEEDETCQYCNGTGEGRYDGSSCRHCGGSGIERWKKDDDDFDAPEEDDRYCDEEGNLMP